MSTETPKPIDSPQPTTPKSARPPWLSIEANVLPVDVACGYCKTYTWNDVDDCPGCDGVGYNDCADCKKDTSKKCEVCLGKREIECEECDGTGEIESDDNKCYDCNEVREGVADDAAYLWRRDFGRNVTNGTAALYVKFAVADYRAALVAKAESEAA